MSSRNGDRSRFHRERKQKIARRKRTRELLERETTKIGSPRVAATSGVSA